MRFKIHSGIPCIYKREEIMEAWYRKLLYCWANLSVSLSLCLFVSLTLCLSISLSLCLFLSFSVFFCLYLFLSVSLCLSVSLSLCLSVSLSLCLSVYFDCVREDLGEGVVRSRVLPPGGKTITHSKFWEN